MIYSIKQENEIKALVKLKFKFRFQYLIDSFDWELEDFQLDNGVWYNKKLDVWWFIR